jgi:hypothetical protein
MSSYRWDPCICHRGREAEAFVRDYFSDTNRRLLFVGGAGFDPRSVTTCTLLASVAGTRSGGLLIRERRPDASDQLVSLADQNTIAMASVLTDARVVDIDVFAADGAVVGGRQAVQAVRMLDLAGVSDIIIDVSALSMGISFPVVRHCLGAIHGRAETVNIHVVVHNAPTMDEAIVATASDRVGTIPGYQGGFGLDSTADAAKLWLPQLALGKKATLERLFAFVNPDDTCPVLPFPAAHPRQADKLLEHYQEELESTWEVDGGNIVYADETNPLDLYRTILTIDEARRRVFRDTGGSISVLSPIGSKALAIGAMLAAIERDLPVAYVEAIGYTVDCDGLDRARAACELTHLWLCGTVYPSAAAGA